MSSELVSGVTEEGVVVQRQYHMPAVLCCLCGTTIEANNAMMCGMCLRSEVNITEGISRQVSLAFCKTCERYLRPPWLRVKPESKELLALCLKKIKGLGKVKLVDAAFLWTEPHSRRLKVQCAVSKELNGTVVDGTFVVEYVLQSMQCDDCKKSYTPHTWNALLQVRQRADHKRTFLYLEQLILKHDAHDKVINIAERVDGLDFQFLNKHDAQRLADFVASYFPVKAKGSRQLTSHDSKSNIYNYKHTMYVELCPICKDDLVYLPPKVASGFGGISQLQLCWKISTSIHLIDVRTFQKLDVSSVKFWHAPFSSICRSRHLSEFVVLDVDDEVIDAQKNFKRQSPGNNRKKRPSCDVEIARIGDLGVNDDRQSVKCGIGIKVKPGDVLLGYDFSRINLSGSESDVLQSIPEEIILVRKAYPKKRENRRIWTLLQLNKDAGGDPVERKTKDDNQRNIDMEDFKSELDHDAEMRKEINLYAKPRKPPSRDGDTPEEEEGAILGEVKLSELLEGLTLDENGRLKQDDDDNVESI